MTVSDCTAAQCAGKHLSQLDKTRLTCVRISGPRVYQLVCYQMHLGSRSPSSAMCSEATSALLPAIATAWGAEWEVAEADMLPYVRIHV